MSNTRFEEMNYFNFFKNKLALNIEFVLQVKLSLTYFIKDI